MTRFDWKTSTCKITENGTTTFNIDSLTFKIIASAKGYVLGYMLPETNQQLHHHGQLIKPRVRSQKTVVVMVINEWATWDSTFRQGTLATIAWLIRRWPYEPEHLQWKPWHWVATEWGGKMIWLWYDPCLTRTTYYWILSIIALLMTQWLMIDDSMTHCSM